MVEKARQTEMHAKKYCTVEVVFKCCRTASYHLWQQQQQLVINISIIIYGIKNSNLVKTHDVHA